MEWLFNRKLEGREYIFYSRILVQLALVFYIILQTDSFLVQFLMLLVFVLLLASNVQLYHQKMLDHRFARKLVLRELVIILPAFPFVAYSPYYIFFLLLLFTTILMLDRGRERLLLTLGLILLPVAQSLYLGVAEWALYGHLILLILFLYSFALAIRGLTEQETKLSAQNEQLEAYAEQELELAIVKERMRIARSSHDQITNKASDLIVRLQRLQQLQKKQGDPDNEKLIVESLDVTRSLLAEMRQGARSMEPPEPVSLSGLDIFSRLVNDLEKSTYMEIHHHQMKLLGELSPRVKTMAYRFLQEGITNAKRHGEASKIQMNCEVLKEQNLLEISIEDNGEGTEDPTKRGVGLTSIEVSLQELGGSLTLDNQAGRGCVLRCTLPYQKE